MTEVFQTERPAALAGAHTGQVLGNIQRLENTMSEALVEAKAFEPVSHNHAVALAYAEYVPAFLADPRPKEDDPASPRKTPLVPRGVHWKEWATKDADKITRKFNETPQALVALPCGLAGLLVIDCDLKRGIDGVANFDALVSEHGGLPEGVVTVATVSGARHVIFKQPDGLALGNSTGALPPGIDVRGVGGYVIVPGTDWHEGGWREEENSPKLLDVLRDGTLPEPPEWLLELLQRRKENQSPPKAQEAFAYERVSQGDCGARVVEQDADLRILSTKKANRAKAGGTIFVRWQDGKFVRDESINAIDATVSMRAEALFLSFLEQFERDGREVGCKPGANYAPAAFAKQESAVGVGKKDFERAMHRLFQRGKIRNETYGPPSRLRKRIVLVPAAENDEAGGGE